MTYSSLIAIGNPGGYGTFAVTTNTSVQIRHRSNGTGGGIGLNVNTYGFIYQRGLQ